MRTIGKVRATRHNGRGSKKGIYSTKHNDRNFDLSNAKHIDPSRTYLNVYWDWKNGMRSGDVRAFEDEEGNVPSFEDAEKDFYAIRYQAYVDGQHARNAKRRHSERDRTIEEIRHDRRFTPEETIFQFGCNGEGATAEQLMAIVDEFRARFVEQYGTHVHILDWALHMDETTVHIQERHCFDFLNQYGEIEPKQEKALEQLGIPLPHPDQKPDKYNNRKMTFDAMNRLMLIEIAKDHGLEIEEEVKYGSREHLEKADYVIAKQRELIEEQQSRIASQDATIAEQATIIAAKDAELTDKEEKLDEVDSLLDEVAGIAYEKAVNAVTATTIREVQNENAAAIDQLIAQVDDPKSGMKKAERAAAVGVLTKLKSAMLEMPKKLFANIVSKLSRPAVREAAKKKVVDAAKPSILSMLQRHGRSGNGRQRYDEAR